MFEMLGNWSFGDYFKKEAIAFSWELLTQVYELSPDRLYVSYFGGDADSGLEPDFETRDLWMAIGVAQDHLLPGNLKDNFWEMGEQGPCGPCSEVHYDRIGGGRNAAHLVNMDDPDVLEIWNNVFIQFNRESDGSLRSLPAKHVDTGMGFERLVSVLQDVSSNYDTDVFAPLFDKIQEITGARPYQGKLGKDDIDGLDTAYRVVADHIRTLLFAIADGGVPNNDGRGYVLRRVLRRGARYVRKKFNYPIGHFFSTLAPTLVEQMSDMFPELAQKLDDAKEILDEEEASFSKTLDRGEKMFEQYITKAKISNSSVVDGADIWRLYETFGFPVDLTQLMAEENGLTIDQIGFEQAQARSKKLSKAAHKAGKNKSDALKLDVHHLDKLTNEMKIPTTDDSFKYSCVDFTPRVLAILYKDQQTQKPTFGESTKMVEEGEQVGIILDKTEFYAEAGGQEHDTGNIFISGKADFQVDDVQVYAGYVLHIGFFRYGEFSVGEDVYCSFDELRRWPIRNNHTGTHILNFALREVLVGDVHQKGSLVAPDRLRFDFSHNKGVSVPELVRIEQICSEYIQRDVEVYSKDVSLSIGEKISGLRAVFGEKYPDPVRVVCVGKDIEEILQDVENPEWWKYSIEYCGGTHVAKTGDIKKLVIIEESAIAKGIRRIIGVTGEEAQQVSRIAEDFSVRLSKLEKMAMSPEKETLVKSTGLELSSLSISAIQKSHLRDHFARLQKEMTDADKAKKNAENKVALDSIIKYFETHPDDQVAVLKVLGVSANPKALSFALTHVKGLGEKSVFLFAADEDEGGKIAHACLVSKSAGENGVNAQDWSRVVCQVIGGRSGGKGESCQGIGTEPMKIDQAVDVAKRYFRENLSI
ncbi:Alanine--tRNA ligase [Neolecta irregularis DAH-3]|uniref:Alanine--tRNA ligase n=1 Tax=Neolecta irregularis (strain DAH-3) TaxID=1198029 RepID=A0A1U7LMS7_NEOID|nr:Alanine--tRNA ligase [Neolecta irregularis DAH-3]|eukprot:OLL23947.1 Alanine--tRNA ligase [Neolecta irregularis DAH-3]